jgi:hypothetical protein
MIIGTIRKLPDSFPSCLGIKPTLPGKGMRYEHEKHRKIVAIEVRIARQARRSGIVLGLVATLGVLALTVIMAFLSGILELPDAR